MIVIVLDYKVKLMDQRTQLETELSIKPALHSHILTPYIISRQKVMYPSSYIEYV